MLRFAREFGETAALRLGIERSRGELILTLPAYFQVQPEGVGPLLDAVSAGPTWPWPIALPGMDSWLNRMQSRGVSQYLGRRVQQRSTTWRAGSGR